MLIRVATLLVIILILTLIIFLVVANQIDYSRGEPTWGITFSPSFSEELGLDPKEVYLDILDDLNVSHLRLPGYWNRIEKTQGQYDFEELDWLVDEASARDKQIILVLGQRQPRWPECHFPEWAAELSESARQEKVLELVQTVVKRYQDNKNIYAWQVENEPLLNLFGQCPKSDIEFLKTEINRVKALDDRPIIISESGELSTWARSANLADVLGVSMYKITWNKYLGYLYYPLTPGFYHQKIELVSPMVDAVICTELQAEPWAPEHINKMTAQEMEQAMSLKTLENNLDMAKRAGFSEIYLWGAEWWYLMKEKYDNSVYWERAKLLWE
ncbi:cellulase family glycosylhydrolase [Patescibacteria group bacterium]|nr:cellulase family glycosylhydrolase [Patescibacteria group bacterium]MBU1922167.1 cellulase family glycosylhydrolase [Patescibacteria group bacterium]